jgi:hypothetical protein
VLGVGDECTANDERRPKQIVDGASAFGNEEVLSLARVTALEVTRYREQAHENDLEVGCGPEFAFTEPNYEPRERS